MRRAVLNPNSTRSHGLRNSFSPVSSSSSSPLPHHPPEKIGQAGRKAWMDESEFFVQFLHPSSFLDCWLLGWLTDRCLAGFERVTLHYGRNNFDAASQLERESRVPTSLSTVMAL